MIYVIMAHSRYGTEEIDQTDNVRDARYLVQEYQLAYGHEWRVWYVRRRREG